MRESSNIQSTLQCGTTFKRFCNYKIGLAWCLLAVLATSMFMGQCEASSKPKDNKMNNRPIIGILAQETGSTHKMFDNPNITSYIAASYVKAVEASGARVVPVMIGKDRDYYEDIMSKLNGVLFPGGHANLSRSALDGYADAGEYIYDIARELNDNGDYFPIFGVCQGFQYLVVLAEWRGDYVDLVPCNCHTSMPLNFTVDFRGSKMFRGIDDETVDALSTKNITVNSHDFCVLDDNLRNHNLTVSWRVTSYSDDYNYGLHFIATIESNKYPFYGTQFHPEKNAYEWIKSKHYPSDKQAIAANRYFYDFFVDECRKSSHSFASPAEEAAKLIYNYAPYYTGSHGSMFAQSYGFES